VVKSVANIAVISLLFVFGALLRGADLNVALQDEAIVARDRVTLDMVAALSGRGDLCAAAAQVVVDDLPTLGQRSIDAVKVRAALASLLRGPGLVVTGRCTVWRRCLVVPEASLVAAAEAHLREQGNPGDEVQVTLRRGSGSLLVSDDADQPVRLVAEALDRATSGDIPCRVRVLRGNNELARALLVLELTRWRTCLVAARPLARGSHLDLGAVRSERLALTRDSSDAKQNAEDLVGWEVRVDLPAGAPILASAIQPQRVVRANQTVVLMVQNERIQVSASGTALAEGNLGDSILVRRATDGRTLRGRISGVGEVQVGD